MKDAIVYYGAMVLLGMYSLSNGAPSADNIFFYRASYFPGLTRLDAKSLTSIDIMAGGGSSIRARNAHGKKITLCGTYQDGHACPEKFNISEAFFGLTQNVVDGVFLYALLPFRSLKRESVYHIEAAELGKPPACQQGMGDASFYLGWTLNYQDTQELDFIDLTAKIGVLAPTATTTAGVFSLGYDQHTGIPFTFDIALGLYDWLTLGGHASAVHFLDKERRLVTCNDNHECIIVRADVHRGPQWLAAGYIQADHFFRGFSLLLCFSCANKYCDCIQSYRCEQSNVVYPTQTTSCLIPAWSMQTLNFLLEYDFTRQDPTAGLRLGAFYNLNVGGRNIVTTGVGGGSLGIEVQWLFD